MRRAASTLALAALALAALGCGGKSVESGTTLDQLTFQDRGVPFVKADDLHAWMEAGHENDVLFLDNRDAFSYGRLHVQGARLVPVDRMDATLGSLPLNKWAILYCT